MQNKRISVLVVCYNQENLIGRTLDSILQQRLFGLHEIVVGDDCSTDGTRNVLLDYQKRYPDIIRPIFNEHNMGIYGNVVNVLDNRGHADLYTLVAGDDSLCDGTFHALQKLIAEKNINTNEQIGIYADWKSVDPEGKECVYRHDKVTTGLNLFSLQLRHFIWGRSLFVSNKVIENYGKIVLDQGLGVAETSYEAQAHLNIKRAFYLPYVSSIYYSNAGISTRLKNKDWNVTQARIRLLFKLENYPVSDKDRFYIKYELIKCDYLEKPSMSGLALMFFYYEKGQLPRCRRSIKYTITMFGSLFKHFFLRNSTVAINFHKLSNKVGSLTF